MKRDNTKKNYKVTPIIKSGFANFIATNVSRALFAYTDFLTSSDNNGDNAFVYEFNVNLKPTSMPNKIVSNVIRQFGNVGIDAIVNYQTVSSESMLVVVTITPSPMMMPQFMVSATDKYREMMTREDGSLLLPEYATSGSSGLDLFAIVDEDIRINPGETKIIPSGLKVQLNKQYRAMLLHKGKDNEFQVRSKSGLSSKKGLIVLNSPATIDADFNGEIGIIVHNVSSKVRHIQPKMLIGQLVCVEVLKNQNWRTVSSFDQTQRNDKGFGHSQDRYKK
ncbi:MAG: dUTP diphosphatase [Peptostreptococcaceae bacterium]